MVNMPALDCYYDNSTCATGPKSPPEIVQNLVHSYGEITRGFQRCPYRTDGDIFAHPQNCTYFYNSDTQEFAFRYSEFNPSDHARTYPYLTNRTIKASASDCWQYNVKDNTYAIDANDGKQETWVFNFNNETYDGSLPIPKPNTAYDSTTYVYNGSSVPQNATVQSCGPRCISLYAFRSYGSVTKRPSVLFQCSVNIGEVSNVTNDKQQIADFNARLAAASIALTGRYTNPNGSKYQQWEQYQLYPFGYVEFSFPSILAWSSRKFSSILFLLLGYFSHSLHSWTRRTDYSSSYWETQDLDAETVGSRMSEFAIGSLAAMANLNPQTSIFGTLPNLGYHLSVEWQYVIALAAGIGFVHCLLVALMLWISRPVIVGADSNLVTARLLKGLVDKLGDGGGLLDDRELAEAIQRDTGDVGYGVRESEQGTVVGLGEGTVVRKRLPGGTFPAGPYA